MSSLCRSSPFSSRTKSLREKFASKRSYSESFKDPPAAAAAAGAAVPAAVTAAARDSPSSSSSARSPSRGEPVPGLLSHSSGSADAASGLVMPPSLPGFMPSYTVMPEDAYCSALDINCQQGDPRFPWQRDAAVQCDLRSLVTSRSSSHFDTVRYAGGSPIRPSSPAAAGRASAGSSGDSVPFRTSTIFAAPGEGGDNAGSPPAPPPRRSGPALQRALSLERSATRKKAGPALLAGTSATTVSVAPGSQLPTALEEGGNITAATAARAASCSPQRGQQPLSPEPSASPKSGQASPAFTRSSPGETTPPLTRRPSAAERRKMCFVRKQTSSAPNSMDEEVPSPSSSVCSAAPSTGSSYLSRNTSVASVPSTGGERPGYFNFESMQRLLDLSMKVPSERKSFYLDIPSQEGLGACRDGKAAYLSLPSPNLQTEEQESSIVFKKLSKPEEEEDEQDEFVEPPASALHRRQALVPPKMLTDGYESSSEDVSMQGSVSNDQNTQKTRRRSSIVVIPPMQICPGDLLVYSKVLTHRNNLLDIDGSTQCLAVSEDSSRKAKNTWSLLRLFDRANRAKTECLGGLEEVLSTLRPSEFCDEQLTKYKGKKWEDFVSSLKNPDADSEDEDENESSGGSAATSPKNGNAAALSAAMAGLASSSASDNLLMPGDADRGSPTAMGDAMQSQFLRTINQTILKNEAKKKDALWELFQSELNFLEDHLMVLKNVFMEPLKKIQVEGYAMFAEPEVLFGNLDELCCVTYAFCKEFISFILATLNSGDFNTTDVLLRLFKKSTKAAALRQAYHRYTLNYINALNYLETLRRQVEFNEFEKWCARDPRCKKLQLTDLLVSPVQHIMRVPLILKEIETRTEDMEERDCITAILEAEENSLRELDDKMKWLKNFERLLEIQRNIVWPPVTELDKNVFIPEFLKVPLSKQPCERLIVSPRRQIILEGSLLLLDNPSKGSEVYVVLFDDMILITKKKKGLIKKKSSMNLQEKENPQKKINTIQDGSKYVVFKQPLSLDRICIHDVNAQESGAQGLKNVFVFVCLNRFQQITTVHTLQASNESTKLTWLTKLRDTVDRWKRTLQNTVFRNQRIAAASNNSAPPK
ncbi:uncharacterized protein LOC144152548 isoform X3 [Haemaphysalis longicornis]